MQTVDQSKQCPVCGKSFPPDVYKCPDDLILLTEKDPLIGTLFDGRYRIERFVGQGGMSLVYQAKQEQLDRMVAIKLLKSQFLRASVNVQRFRREAHAASLLQHPNINAVYAFGVASGQPYLVLEFLEGTSLAGLLAQTKPLSAQRAVAIFIQIAAALAHAHGRGVIHRDLKPSNVVIVRDADGSDLVKVVDFGTAKIAPEIEVQQALTQAGEVLGTLLYMAPEQKKGGEADARSDIYAVGVMLHEAIASEGVLPGQIKPIVEKALAEDPKDRYQSAAQLQADLQSVAAACGHGQDRTGQIAKRSSKRLVFKFKPAMLLLLALLLIGGAIGAILAISPVQRASAILNWCELTNAPPDQLVQAANKLYALQSHAGIYNDKVQAAVSLTSARIQGEAWKNLGQIALSTGDQHKLAHAVGELTALLRTLGASDQPLAQEIFVHDQLPLSISMCFASPFTVDKETKLMMIGYEYERRKLWTDGAALYQRLYDVQKTNPGENPDHMLVTLASMVRCVQQIPDLARRAEIAEEGIKIIETSHRQCFEAAGLFYDWRGEALRDQGKYREADEALRQAVDLLLPDKPGLGGVYVQLGLVNAVRNFSKAKTCEYLEQARAINVRHPMDPNIQGAMFAQLLSCYNHMNDADTAYARWEEAVSKLGRFAYIMPNLAEEAMTTLADLHRQADRTALAQQTFRMRDQAKTLQKSDAAIALCAAVGAENSGNGPQMEYYLRRAIALEPSGSTALEAHHQLGLFLFWEKDFRGAEQELRAAVQLSEQTAASAGERLGLQREYLRAVEATKTGR